MRETSLRENVEYWLVMAVARTLGAVPRGVARLFAGALAFAVYHALGRLRRVGERNLELAFPGITAEKRAELLRGVYRSLGRQLVEFCRMSGYTAENTRDWIRTEGLEYYLASKARGKGVLIVTGHLGAWELSSFYHSLMGYPMSMVIRRLDNRRLDAYVNAVRCLHGNRVLHKDEFARGLLTAMRAGETVGILMDTNMTPPQGVFVPFFGVEACTASGLARVAQKTGAAVLPGLLLWEERERQYVLRFGPELRLAGSGDSEADAASNTALFTGVIEAAIREHPAQWLWMHRRWKTRPAGQPPIY